jgi:ubiquinone/menaquinone biosynthesis C-methylase UbiE
MRWLEWAHRGYVQHRRIERLADHLSPLLPEGATVLDVGCGDGELTFAIQNRRKDLKIQGIEVLVRPGCRVEVAAFDGQTIPFEDRRFDVVLLADVVHHATDPLALLREVARVARTDVVIKDHLLEGWGAEQTLRFMDRVGNQRFGVFLPYHYWIRSRWLAVFGEMGFRVEQWRERLNLYPSVAGLIFDRKLHFVAKMRRKAEVVPCMDESKSDEQDLAWESAYLRFETPAQEVRKFRNRLWRIGAKQWDHSDKVLELFCGRGGGLKALRSIHLRNVQGADRSLSLLRQYEQKEDCFACDCRRLPLADGIKDVVIVQGGLHHLKQLPDDLHQTLSEARRVLREGGRMVIVEPWLTPFLGVVHWFCGQRWARRAWKKLDALARMIELEHPVYQKWLAQPDMIMAIIEQYFEPIICQHRWGKLIFVGRGRPIRQGR